MFLHVQLHVPPSVMFLHVPSVMFLQVPSVMLLQVPSVMMMLRPLMRPPRVLQAVIQARDLQAVIQEKGLFLASEVEEPGERPPHAQYL